MNSYEIAVLRILVKRQTPIKISDLIFGFPDNSGGRVLHAISNLHSLGYVLIYGAPFDGYLLLAKDKRREAIRIISSNISNDNQARGSSYSEQIVNPSIKNKTFILLAMMGIAALSIVIISALAITSAGSPLSYPSTPYLSRYVSMDQLSSSPISVFTPSDQYTGSTSLRESTGPNTFVVISSISEPTTIPMVDRVSTANPDSVLFI
jgi:hypothetical protein